MLNKNIPVPLYYQLKERLTVLIKNGDLAVGSLLPSEREFSDQYSISRMTVRQALGELVKEGLLIREQGKGTYVAEPKINQGLFKLTSFSEEMKNRGFVPGSKILSVHEETIGNQSDLSKRLSLAAEQKVIVVERVRLADDKPMAFEIARLPFSRFPNFNTILNENQSLYEYLSSSFNLDISYAKQTIEVGLPNTQEAKILHITKSTPVLKIQRVTYDQNREPFEFVESVYRGDRYKLEVELNR